MNKLGIYVHIPFCEERCHYCDFLSFTNVDYDIPVYIECLNKEIKMHAENLSDYIVDSIFFGGGTPSYLKEGRIRDILILLREKFNVADDCEISIEVNPNSLSDKKIKEYKDIGINRISLAVQSFNDEILKVLGRNHTKSQALSDFNQLRENGFNNISIDLMMGVPFQTLDNIKEDLKVIKELSPEHISYYSLILEEKTLFNVWLKEGKINLPEEDLEREMYHLAVSSLKDMGLFRYEVSNFSKEEFKSRHNLKYWNLDEYLGIGLGSASYINGKRFNISRSFQKYIKEIKNNNLPIENIEEISNIEGYREYIMLKSRLSSGYKIKQIKEKYNVDILKEKKNELGELLNQGLIEIRNDSIFLTDKGFDLENQVILALI